MHKPEFSKALGALLLSIVLALWPASQSFAQAAKHHPSINQTASSAIHESDFPTRIAGMARVGMQEYGVPELGFSVRYVSPDKVSWADIYIYDKGLDLGSAASASHADNEIRSSLGDVKTLVERGVYKDASYGPIAREGKFATVHIRADIHNRRTASILAMAVHNSKFVKLRLSTPDGPKSLAVQSSFLNALSRELGI